MRSFVIRPQDDGIRLNRYLMRTAPSLPAAQMHKYLRTKRIRCNGKRCEAASRLRTGDVLELFIDDSYFEGAGQRADFLRADRNLTVLYEDDHLLALYKPAGLLSHAVDGTQTDSLQARLLRYLYDKRAYAPDRDVAFAPALCNRLDRGTEGIVLAAKTAPALQAVNAALRERKLKKYYLCAVTGAPPKDGVYTAYLTKNKRDNIARISNIPAPGAKPVSTGIRFLEKKGALSLLRIDLQTGRPHQIRAHLAHLGCPVLGDAKYGDLAANRRYGMTRQALCAYKVVFCADEPPGSVLHDLNGKSITLETVSFVEKLHFQRPYVKTAE